MTLYTEQHGSGPDVVLLHGWSLHGGIFHKIVPELAKSFRLTVVDMPGHGRSRDVVPEPFNVSTLAEAVAGAVPENAHWIGWSMGGMVTMRGALDFPGRIGKLVLIGTTPKYVRSRDWPYAMEKGTLQQFSEALSRDFRGTLDQFLQLQARGLPQMRELVRELKEQMFAHGEPHPAVLQEGLGILFETDLREELEKLNRPTLVCHGDRDTLIPVSAGKELAKRLPDARLHLFRNAGHAPFLTHEKEFLETTTKFLKEA